MRITYIKPIASDQRVGWAMHVTAVDKTMSNSHAFTGEFLLEGEEIELPLGAVIVEKVPVGGSVRNGRVYRITHDGLVRIGEPWDWDREFLTLRDAVAAELAE